jgi:chromosome segregation ATPase
MHIHIYGEIDHFCIVPGIKMASFARDQDDKQTSEQNASLYAQVQKLQEQVQLRKLYCSKVTEKINDLTKEKHLLDLKISGINSNFNRLHALTQTAIRSTKRKQKERIAGEREIENLKRQIRNHSIEINNYNEETTNLTSETNGLKESLNKLNIIVRQLRRGIQKNKLDSNKHASERNFLVTRDKTVKGRVDQSISQNAQSIVQIEQLLMDVDKLNNEPF